MKVAITGLSGALARMVAERLLRHGHTIVGIDRRPWPDAPPGVEMHHADIRKRPAEDVFRTRRPDALIHMATVTHLSASFEERYRINLTGTQQIFEHCHAYGTRAAIFVGRHTVYGAAPDAPLYRTEEHPPLAMATLPDLADLVAADLFAATSQYRWPSVDMIVLRLVYTLGPSRRGTLAAYLGKPRVPTVLGFDPLFQFMHEHDAADAIALALEKRLRGIYNVAGPQPVPLSVLCRETGRVRVPVPEPLFGFVSGRPGFPELEAGAVNHIKYPIVVSGDAFVKATGFRHNFDEAQTMEAFRWA
jgi:UDP-glucose 4-epimerase